MNHSINNAKHRFYVARDHISDGSVVFPEEESRHATRVLRIGMDDHVTVVDGEGATHLVRIETIGKRSIIGRIEQTWQDLGEPIFELYVGLALLKQGARWESFLEKAVESGCSRIIPLLTERTQAKKFNRRRADAIIKSAVKQCERSRAPRLDDPSKFSALLDLESDLKLICHESIADEDNPVLGTRLGQVLGSFNGDIRAISVLVGPEGGFSDHEMAEAMEMGWKSIWLGKRRLRAETAAMTAVSMISQLLDERPSAE